MKREFNPANVPDRCGERLLERAEADILPVEPVFG
jgi:hypothetical protein